MRGLGRGLLSFVPKLTISDHVKFLVVFLNLILALKPYLDISSFQMNNSLEKHHIL